MYRFNSEWTTDLNVKAGTEKKKKNQTFKEDIEENVYAIEFGNDFLDMIMKMKIQVTKEK